MFPLTETDKNSDLMIPEIIHAKNPGRSGVKGTGKSDKGWVRKSKNGRGNSRSDRESEHGKQDLVRQLWMEVETEGQTPKEDV